MITAIDTDRLTLRNYDNIPSQRLCERLGMRQEALFHEFISFVDNPDGTKYYEDTNHHQPIESRGYLRNVAISAFLTFAGFAEFNAF
jgi:hypothetical protein